MDINKNITDKCSPICDRWVCWPITPINHTAKMPCPQLRGILENAMASKYCTINGTWEVRNGSDGTLYNYTNYEPCIMPQIRDITKMCNKFGPNECVKISRVTRDIEMVGLALSSISLIVSLYIYFTYRILKNNRTKIHKNLFMATLLQVIFRLIKYTDQELDENHQFLSNNYYMYEICTVLMEYSKTAMFTWMFIEGLYLNNMLTSKMVFRENDRIKCYIWCGWIIPAIMTLVWLSVMIFKKIQRTWIYYYFLPYYWILEGPRSTMIIINLIFLLNIIRVLVVKLRKTRSSEIEQLRKAVRATIFLLPLMGITHILFLLDYRFDEAWKFQFWSYTSYFLTTFQGFFVAVIYCFLNGEVQSTIKLSWCCFSINNYNTYSRCKNFTLISSLGHNVTETEQSISPFRWIKCCRNPQQSPEEKEIDLCDINTRKIEHQQTTAIIIIEKIPMIDKQRNGTVTTNNTSSSSTTEIHETDNENIIINDIQETN